MSIELDVFHAPVLRTIREISADHIWTTLVKHAGACEEGRNLFKGCFKEGQVLQEFYSAKDGSRWEFKYDGVSMWKVRCPSNPDRYSEDVVNNLLEKVYDNLKRALSFTALYLERDAI